MKQDTILFLDAEIRREVLLPGQDPIPGIEYCRGFDDFAAMGIACVAVIEVRLWPMEETHGPTVEMRGARVFCSDNLHALQVFLNSHIGVVTFNGTRFDVPLLAANGVQVDRRMNHMDLAQMVWRAAGIDDGDRPRGLGLNDLCRANFLPGKSGLGAEAPRHWQRGNIGQVIDYCLNDVILLVRLFELARHWGQLRDPRVVVEDMSRTIYLGDSFTGFFR